MRLVGEGQDPDQQLGVGVGARLVAQVREHLSDRVVERLDPAAAKHRTGHVEDEDEVEGLARQSTTEAIGHLHLPGTLPRLERARYTLTPLRSDCPRNRSVMDAQQSLEPWRSATSMVLANGTEVDLGALGRRPGRVDDRSGWPGLRLRGRASGRRAPLALKWYKPESATSEQHDEIQQLVEFGSPHGRFLWPMSMARASGQRASATSCRCATAVPRAQLPALQRPTATATRSTSRSPPPSSCAAS